MNVVREINKINELELQLGVGSASWHDEYKDSAYIFVGGLDFELTEGDVITIFSQYGEILDINMPRDKMTGKPRGFAFLMYEDQRSTVLAVDNLNGAKVLEKILRVDHVKDYKQPGKKGEDGEWIEPEEQSFNARPEMIIDEGADSDVSDASSAPSIDPEDPMRDFLLAQRREQKALAKTGKLSKKSDKQKSKRKDETAEERRARKERKREKREKKQKKAGKSEGVRAVEALLSSIGGLGEGKAGKKDVERSRGYARSRSRSRTPERRRSMEDDVQMRDRSRNVRRSRSRSPRRRRDSRERRDDSRSRDRH